MLKRRTPMAAPVPRVVAARLLKRATSALFRTAFNSTLLPSMSRYQCSVNPLRGKARVVPSFKEKSTKTPIGK
jgi:hypothetical protein